MIIPDNDGEAISTDSEEVSLVINEVEAVDGHDNSSGKPDNDRQ